MAISKPRDMYAAPVRRFGIFIRLVPLIAIVILLGCSDSDEAPAPNDIRYEMRHFAKTFGVCDTTGQPCLTIMADYPKFSSPSATAVADSINNAVHLFLLPMDDNGDQSANLETFSQNLITEYRQLLANFPDYVAPWFVTKEIVAITDTASILSIRSYESSFTGGAHPNSVQSYANFDLRTGKRLSLADVLADGFRGPLTDTAEKIFRVTRGVSPSQDLGEVGFWFEENRFTLNDNFAITRNGLIFYYNSYEIAPYAAGPTRILIPYDRIRHLIRENGPLAFAE